MNRVFFIDSENVGDAWTMLLDAVDAEDEVLVFYTQKSPHMSYRNLIRLKESSIDVTFIECFEGTNALDFQLVTELGYRISQDADRRYFIISNDNGFESVVKYWKRRNYQVKRLPGKACMQPESFLMVQAGTSASLDNDQLITDDDTEISLPAVRDEQTALAVPGPAVSTGIPSPEANKESRGKSSSRTRSRSKKNSQNKKTAGEEPAKEPFSEILTVPETQLSEDAAESAQSESVPVESSQVQSRKQADDQPSVQTQVQADAQPDVQPESQTAPEPVEEVRGVDEESLEVLYCIGKENLADLHEALVQLYGDKRCQVLYNAFKSDPSYEAFLDQHATMFPDERQRLYTQIVFSAAGSEMEPPTDLAESVMRSWRRKKNLNSLRAALQNKYGKENGLKYYSLLKAHIKVINNIS